MHTVSYLSRLLAITDRQELNFKLHKARGWSVLNRFHSWIPERPLGYSISIALFNNVFLFAKRVYEQKQKQSKTLIGVRLFEYVVEMKYNV